MFTENFRWLRKWFCLYLYQGVVLLIVGGVAAGPGSALAAPLETANVMAPLHIEPAQMADFEAQLAAAREIGVDAVSVDVWWGDVERAGDNVFDWSYYDTLFTTIRAHHLKIVPILSFHQCGGNVGDTYTSLIPTWLWTKYQGKTFKGVQLDDKDLQYRSEYGNYSRETVQLWADELVLSEYTDFTAAFASHFASFAGAISELNVSAGPAGELRYPSYNGHDCGPTGCLTGYPTRGGLQAYSRLAVADFQAAMLKKYQSLAGVNAAWKTMLASTSEILPPNNHDLFFDSGDYRKLQYGKDFVDWYNQALVDHGRTLLRAVARTLGSALPSAKLGFKIPGVHWAMAHPTHPRAAEVAAGLIQTSVNLDADETGHGYANIVGLAKQLATPARPVVLHFTCLEMSDQNDSGQYSLAKSLVFWVANEAKRQGVTIKGENALSGGVTSNDGWNNIDNAFKWSSYSGFTVLRIGDVASGLGRDRYAAFIQKFRASTLGFPSLFVRGTNNAWKSAPMIKAGDVWLLKGVHFGNTNQERFKFDVAGDWRDNYGAYSSDSLAGLAKPGGADIRVESNGTYDITFDEAAKSYAARSVTNNQAAWFFRGTPNHWASTAMKPRDGKDSFQITATFAAEDPAPRFKIDRLGNWSDSYPAQDIQVSDCATYQITFDAASKGIEVKKLADVVSGACGDGKRDKLGVSYTRASSTFALWSPSSEDVQLWLDGKTYAMSALPGLPARNGMSDVYAVTVPGDQHGKRYNFRVNGRVARDPYGVMVDPDPSKNQNIVVDLTRTEPLGGWAPRPPLAAREDSVLYELHVRDFTIDASSGVPAAKRGKFAGLTVAGTKYQGFATGLDHLKELGITHVQLLPIFDFASCPIKSPPGCYSWGYDPVNYNVPEERYATSTDPVERIRELKTMINELHKAGIRVIMDVVYNHSAAEHENTFSPISDAYFTAQDLSGTGNSIDASKPMVSAFIRDSLDYWVSEYHVDGFRFDLIGVFDYSVVGDWARQLNQRHPDAMLLAYGEPWNGYAADSSEGTRVRLGTVARIADAHVGVFNPKFREALKGNNDDGKGGGYVFNRSDDLFSIAVGTRGSIRASRDPFVPIDTWDKMFAADPEQSINYVSAHDNLNLRDRILAWAAVNGVANETGYLKRIQEFATATVLTSQGIAFLQAGDEMLRTKQGDANSYKSPDAINAIKWKWKADNADVVAFTRSAIAMRRAHPGLRLQTWDEIDANVTTTTPRSGVVVDRINADARADSWNDILVIYNSGDNFTYALPDGSWKVALEKSDPVAGQDRSVSGSVVAEGTAVTVLHQSTPTDEKGNLRWSSKR